MLSTITVIGGSILFLDQDKTLIQLKTSGETEKGLVLVCMTVGALVCVGLIEIVQRKVSVILCKLRFKINYYNILFFYTYKLLTTY